MNSERVIVGVFGNTIETTASTKSFEAALQENALIGDAARVGSELIERGHVVLTGGSHRRVEISVKYAAFYGAINAATNGDWARIVGVLPMTISADSDSGEPTKRAVVRDGAEDRLRYVYLHTPWASQKRNAISGAAVDVAIALHGGNGTAMEVAAAFNNQRPIVFLKSADALTHHLDQHLDSEDVHRLIASSATAATPEEAVEKALAAVEPQRHAFSMLRSTFRPPVALPQFPHLSHALSEAMARLLQR